MLREGQLWDNYLNVWSRRQGQCTFRSLQFKFFHGGYLNKLFSPLKPVVGMCELKQGIDSQLSSELGDRLLSQPRSNLYFARDTVRESPGREKCRQSLADEAIVGSPREEQPFTRIRTLLGMKMRLLLMLCYEINGRS